MAYFIDVGKRKRNENKIRIIWNDYTSLLKEGNIYSKLQSMFAYRVYYKSMVLSPIDEDKNNKWLWFWNNFWLAPHPVCAEIV